MLQTRFIKQLLIRKIKKNNKVNKNSLQFFTIKVHINNVRLIITARWRTLGQGNVFTGVCLSTGGRVGFPACITGHMTRGVCIQGAFASVGGGGVGQASPPIGYYGIPSTSGWYASYWNAFLYWQKVCAVRIHFSARMHSSRMRTARSLTISPYLIVSGRGHVWHACYPCRTCPPAMHAPCHTCPPTMHAPPATHPPAMHAHPRWQTDTCKNINFANFVCRR